MEKHENFEIFDNIDVAITVCDNNFKIIYMNEKAIKTFEKYGDRIGKNLLDCHNENSKGKLITMMEKAQKNTYTISKNGVKKIIHQTPWFLNSKIAGLIEFSIEIPENMEHFDRN